MVAQDAYDAWIRFGKEDEVGAASDVRSFGLTVKACRKRMMGLLMLVQQDILLKTFGGVTLLHHISGVCSCESMVEVTYAAVGFHCWRCCVLKDE